MDNLPPRAPHPVFRKQTMNRTRTSALPSKVQPHATLGATALACASVLAVTACAPASDSQATAQEHQAVSDQSTSDSTASATTTPGKSTPAEAASDQLLGPGDAQFTRYNPSQVALKDVGPTAYVGSIPSNLLDPDKKVMYLTFDDGPNTTYTPRLLKVLKKHNAKATFFVLGQNVARNKAQMKELYAAGHAIGSHTWDHPNLKKLTASAVQEQMERTDEAIGARTTCMRPPYGATNKATRKVLVDDMDKWVLHWDLGSGDWLRYDAAKIADTLVTGAKNGALTLMHDGGGKRDATIDGVDMALTTLAKQGYSFDVLPMCQLEPLK